MLRGREVLVRVRRHWVERDEREARAGTRANENILYKEKLWIYAGHRKWELDGRVL